MNKLTILSVFLVLALAFGAISAPQFDVDDPVYNGLDNGMILAENSFSIDFAVTNLGAAPQIFRFSSEMVGGLDADNIVLSLSIDGVDVDQNEEIEFEAGEEKLIRIEVSVPRDVEGGQYDGTLTVSERRNILRQLPFSFEVLPIHIEIKDRAGHDLVANTLPRETIDLALFDETEVEFIVEFNVGIEDLILNIEDLSDNNGHIILVQDGGLQNNGGRPWRAGQRRSFDFEVEPIEGQSLGVYTGQISIITRPVEDCGEANCDQETTFRYEVEIMDSSVGDEPVGPNAAPIVEIRRVGTNINLPDNAQEVTVDVGTVVQLEAVGQDPENDLLTYSWEILRGNDRVATYNGPTVTHTFTPRSDYTLRVSVTDNIEGRQLVTDTIIVHALETVFSVRQNNVAVSNAGISFNLGDSVVNQNAFAFSVVNEGNRALRGLRAAVGIDFNNNQVIEEAEINRIRDTDGREITFSFNPPGLINLEVNDDPNTANDERIASLTVSALAADNFEFGIYHADLLVVDGALILKKVPLTLTLIDDKAFCKEGVKAGKLEVSIKDIDDTIKPGEKIKLEVNVNNKHSEDLRVKVGVSLINLNSGRLIERKTTDNERINDNEDKDFTLEFEIDPEKVDDGDQLMFFVKAYENNQESTNCAEDSETLTVEKEDDDVRITEVRVLPNALQCGQSGEVAVDVRNFGGDDQDVRVKVVNRELGLERESTQFELQEDEDANKAKLTFRFDVPKGTEAGAYDIEARVLYSGKDESSFAPLTVTCTVPKATEEEREEKTEIERVKDVGVAVPSGVKTIDTVTAQPNVVQQSIFDKFNSPNTTPVALWVLADLILVLIVVFIIYLVVRRR